MTLAEALLLRCSKDPADEFLAPGERRPSRWSSRDPLAVFRRDFPDFDDKIRGKAVLDYGCGDGYQAVAMAEAGAVRVLGVDIDEQAVQSARQLAAERGVDDRVEFDTSVRGGFDVVTSLSAMEHFLDPAASLFDMTAGLGSGGVILMTFGPPWLAPYGSHMHFFTKLPWVNVLFSEKTVHRIRSLYRGDGATTYEPGLNRMTVRKFERLVRSSGLRLVRNKYRGVRGFDRLGLIPGLREFFVNQIVAVLAVG